MNTRALIGSGYFYAKKEVKFYVIKYKLIVCSSEQFIKQRMKVCKKEYKMYKIMNRRR